MLLTRGAWSHPFAVSAQVIVKDDTGTDALTSSCRKRTLLVVVVLSTVSTYFVFFCESIVALLSTPHFCTTFNNFSRGVLV